MQAISSTTVSIIVPAVPDNLNSLSPDEINKALIALVGAKSQLERALRRIRAALKKYEGVAKDPNQQKHFQELNALKTMLETTAAKQFLSKE